ncbi:MAG: hypothetical protein WCL44_02400 [bacterium]
MLPQGTISAIVRTLAYSSLGGAYAAGTGTGEMTRAMVVGGVSADYITWAIRTLMQLPGSLPGGGYEAFVNALFGWFVFRHIVIDTHLADEPLVVAFIAFMLVLSMKLFYYAYVYFRDEESGW